MCRDESFKSDTKEHYVDFIESRPEFDDNLPNEYICDYGLEYFRSNRLPPRCILNELDVGTIPDEMKMLNPYEKVLLQRAKCFQTVTRMGTVAKKHLPPTHKVQKVRGTTFHLPLPLQETLKRLPEPHQPLATNYTFYYIASLLNQTKFGRTWLMFTSVPCFGKAQIHQSLL